VVNLYHRDDQDAQLEVVVSGLLGPRQLCARGPSEDPVCEYVFKGLYDDSRGTYACCPRGDALVVRSGGVCQARAGSRRRLRAAQAQAPDPSKRRWLSSRRDAAAAASD
jgi:hypothetical protein